MTDLPNMDTLNIALTSRQIKEYEEDLEYLYSMSNEEWTEYTQGREDLNE